MKTNLRGARLVKLLLSTPAAFYQAGTGIELLQAYFEGFPLETLRPLLASPDRMVRRVAVWIASELGRQGKPLLESASALIKDDDPYIRFYALEVLAVCSLGRDLAKYSHVIRSLDDADDYVRVHVMFLMSNADASQLEAAAKSCGSNPTDELHKKGLLQLVAEQLDERGISRMTDAPEALLRKYGAIAAWRFRQKFPELLSRLSSSDDPDIRRFWERRVGGAKSATK